MKGRFSAMNIPFKPIDDLFEPTIQKTPEKTEKTELDLNLLHPFKNHPFRLYTEDRMAEMVESVKEVGVITPILVRPNPDGEGYEIVSGHNRVEASRRAGLETVPAIIRELDDDTAIIYMVDSNLRQRDKLLPSEKAKAYQMKMEAMERKLGRPSKNVGQVVPDYQGKRTTEIIGEESGDSYKQVQRYLRLNKLIPELQEAVDQGKLAFNPAVEISHLSRENQELVSDIMSREDSSPSLAQAVRLKQMSSAGEISEDSIEEVMTEEKPMYETITFRRGSIEKFFPSGTSARQMEQTIIGLMEQYQRTWQRERSKGMER